MARTSKDSRVGKRVEIAPHYDLWMRGARYGVVRYVIPADSIGPERLVLRMDHPHVRRLVNVLADDVTFR